MSERRFYSLRAVQILTDGIAGMHHSWLGFFVAILGGVEVAAAFLLRFAEIQHSVDVGYAYGLEQGLEYLHHDLVKRKHREAQG